MRHNSLRTVLSALGFLALLASPIRAQNFPSYVNGSPIASSTQAGDEIPLIRGGATFKIDPALFGGGGGALTLTDGTHTVAGATQVTTNCTVGGTTPNATQTCSGSGTVTNALNLANGGVVVGDGGVAGVKTTATGTGVVTALGVNVGTAGAVLVNGGALGTPVSGTATNLTGIAAGLTAGNVTTNANLTGPVTSTGNATAIANGAIALAKLGGEVDGDCVLGVAGAWAAGSCGGASSVSITASTPDVTISPSPLTGTGTIGFAGRTAVHDANCGTLTASASALEAFDTVLTAARSCTLPAASAMKAGQRIVFADEGNGTNPAINGANTVTINRAGADKIAGATSIVMSFGYCAVALESDGVANWGVIESSCSSVPIAQVSGLGTGVSTALGNNLSANGGLTTTIASGATALGIGAISSATCATAVVVAATNTLTTDVVIASFNGDPTAVTGYVPLTAGMLTIIAYPTADTVNFKVCNNTTGLITPGAITLNWRVVR